jgi:hypothetical protein
MINILGSEISCSTRNGMKIIWDVERALKVSQKYGVKNIKVDEYFDASDGVNQEFAMNTERNEPIIVANIGNGKHTVIDGKHRIFKAKKLGHNEILAYIVPEKEIKNCIVDFNEKKFNQYLDE